jgi:hypothetical protein
LPAYAQSVVEAAIAEGRGENGKARRAKGKNGKDSGRV